MNNTKSGSWSIHEPLFLLLLLKLDGLNPFARVQLEIRAFKRICARSKENALVQKKIRAFNQEYARSTPFQIRANVIAAEKCSKSIKMAIFCIIEGSSL
ncbi:hypothetical protein [Planococcus sp. NCCP-2050]|uniref:hypothetical protein n=1 Tax=Planococcus sp. NCCP-2050 TaxID=2944679 RepID=UPI00203CF774|nr:hypothetical protein [Planococcus sp. NCCP-2050]